MSPTSLRQRVVLAVQRTGATVPGADPRPTHGASMEGWFWRVTDPAAGRVLVVLCGVNRHPQGDWATVAIAAHPGGDVLAAVLPDARASEREFLVGAGGGEAGAFEADDHHVRLRVGSDAIAEIHLGDTVGWPMRLGGGGVFSSVPWLGQYWHPHIIGGHADATFESSAARWSTTGAQVYAEKNWGAGFPERWWWGQAQGFERDDVCVAFGGGLLRGGRFEATVSGAVIRVGDEVIRMAPPFARVKATTDGERWDLTARGVRHRLRLIGEGVGEPHVLPVPLPAERRNVFTDFEHLAGRLTVELDGPTRFSGTSELAGLEIGHRPAERRTP